MALIFQYRSTQLDAWHATERAKHILSYGDSLSPPAIAAVSGEVGVFGGNYLDVKNPSTIADRVVAFAGEANVNGAAPFSVLARLIPRFTGAPGDNFHLVSWCNALGLQERNAFEMYVDASGLLYITMYDKNGNVVVSANTNSPLSFTSGHATDLMISWDGSATAGSVKFSRDGVLVQTIDPLAAMVSDNSLVRSICLGSSRLHQKSNFDVNEVVIWDTAENPVYAVRSDFMSAPNFDGSAATDPGIANVKNGTSYLIGGNTLTGTLASTDPGAANVADGVAYEIESAAKVGTLVSTDPGVENVLSGQDYIINSVGKIGTLLSTDPGVASVRKGITYAINSMLKVGALDLGDPAIQRDLAVGPQTVITGESLELFQTVMQKLFPTQPLDLSYVSEIVAKFQNADGTTLSVTSASGQVSISDPHAGRIKIDLTPAQTTLLEVLEGAPLMVILTNDGDTAIYDYSGQLTVAAPTIS